ncbi:MAG: 3-phosphoshikimate 1-carboxyvinyltransferase [Myxococcota bacterium]
MTRLIVHPSGALRGRVRVPGDKSIGHRALIFASLARGESRIEGLSDGEDNRSTLEVFRSMGVGFDQRDGAVVVHGVGLRGLSMPTQVLDCGNSGTTMRLLAGLLSGQRFGSRMVGDESLSKRPMLRVVGPLRARGAHVAGSPLGAAGGRAPDGEQCYAPISIAPLVEGEGLAGIEYDMPVASAQVKSCLLLSGLYAEGPTVLREPSVSRDHTERMMLALGVPLETAGSMVALNPQDPDWSGGWNGFEWTVPGDISGAAFPIVAALSRPDSQITVEGVGVNPTRTGILDLLRLIGAGVQSIPKPDGAGGEPVADLQVTHGSTRPGLLGGELLVRMIDEVPIFCALAARIEGTTEIRDAAELRVKETDRIAAMARVLTAFGVKNEELEDGMRIHGGGALKGAKVHSEGDHRIAMSAAILGLSAEGETVIEGAESIATSFPNFVDVFRSLGADMRFAEPTSPG